MNKKSEALPSLEASLDEINTLIEKMEHGELTLEQSLAHFERGIMLVKHCQKVLHDAEQKVQILMKNAEAAELAPYDLQDKSGEGSANANDH